MSLSTKLKTTAFRLAVGGALMIGPIIGCGQNDDDYGYYYGGAASSGSTSFSGSSSGSSGGATTEPEHCDRVSEGAYCFGEKSTSPCERGKFANASCNSSFVCRDSDWVLEPPQRACEDKPACPAAYTESAPGMCDGRDAISTICEYDEGTCGCAPSNGREFDAGAEPLLEDAEAGIPEPPDAGTRTYEWKCTKPKTEGCPRTRPHEGLSCVRPLECDYGYCLFQDGSRMDCYKGSWVRFVPTKYDVQLGRPCDQ